MTIIGTAGKSLLGVAKFPFKHPKIAFALIGGLATTATMATTSLSLGPAFGKVSGQIAYTGLNAIKKGIPYIFNNLVENTPDAVNSTIDWGKSIFDASKTAASNTDLDFISADHSTNRPIRARGRAGLILNAAKLLLEQ